MPADLAWFKKNTLNKPVMMGHKTFNAIGRALPNRHNIIISRQSHPLKSPVITWVNSINDAMSIAKQQQAEEVFIIGGGSIYQQTLPLANRLYLTHIEADLHGDTSFPDYVTEQWNPIYQEDHQADDKNPYPYQFEILARK